MSGMSAQEQGTGFPAGAILDNWLEDPWTNGVQVDRIAEDMEKLAVRTRNSLYEITIIGRSKR